MLDNILDRQLAFNEQKINQQKDEARQNMETEQRKAKNDYVNYTNPYGLQAESFASQGLLNSGVSETAKLGGYNTYQNRLSNANKVMQDAIKQYDLAMDEARLNNDVQKAENAAKKLQMQLQFSENYYSNRNDITQNQLTNSQNLDNEYFNRYNTEYNNIQEEKAREEAIRQWEAQMAEEQRQYNDKMAYQREQDALAQQNWEAQMAYQKEQDALAQQNWEKEYELSKQAALNSIRSSSSSSGSSSSNSSISLSNSSSNNKSNSTNINTNYWQGPINPDTKYGTFATEDKNGVRYQPDNVSGSKLHKTGDKIENDIGISTNIWKSENGKYYYWEGRQNKYIDITTQYKAQLQSNNKTKAGSSGNGF